MDEKAGHWPHLAALAEEIAGLIGAWEEFGYPPPLPAPDCAPIPALGDRRGPAITAGHEAIAAIDKLTRELHATRARLAGELRQNSDILMARLDAKYGPLAEGSRP